MIGIVLWFDKRDGNGIVKFEDKEYYIDSSVINGEVKRGDTVKFEINDNIKDCLCGKNVEVLS